MKEIFLVNGKFEERAMTTFDYFKVGHKYVAMSISLVKENNGVFMVMLQDLTDNSTFLCPLQTLQRSKGNYATAVFKNKDVCLFDAVFTLDNKSIQKATLTNGTEFLKKEYTFTFLYEL